MSFDDLWEDAGVPSAIAYLQGNKHLEIPAEWQEHLFPTMET